MLSLLPSQLHSSLADGRYPLLHWSQQFGGLLLHSKQFGTLQGGIVSTRLKKIL